MRIRAVIAALPLLALTACGSSTATTPTTGGSGATDSSGASVSAAATLGPAVPAATVVAAPVPPAEMPTATGKIDQKPTLTFPKGDPPNSLQRKVLVEGTGAPVVSGAFLVTNYLGQIWGGKVFDNSYDKKTTATFQIGRKAVVPGWDTALVGVKIGSRVMLSLPPADGYTSAGNASAGISGTDTLVFVIDLKSQVLPTATGQTTAKLQALPKDVPQVSGALGHEPKITIAKGLAEPTVNKVYLVAKGTGPAVKAGSVLAQLVVSDWAQTQVSSTWPAAAGATPTAADATADNNKGLQSITVSADSPIKDLIGIPMGSRVLVVLAASTSSTTGQSSSSAAAVVDLVAQG